MTVFLDGKFLKEEKAKISVFDRGFLYGDGLFETIRFYKGEPFAWKEHLKRLSQGLKYLKIDLPYSSKSILCFSKKLIEINGLNDKDAYLRITVTRGVKKELRDFSYQHPTVFIYTKPLNLDDIQKKREKGIRGVTVPFYRGDLAFLKHIGYLPSLVALMEADRKDVEPIFTKNGNLLEGATSNLFFLKQEIVITPKKDVLKGVMRDFIIKVLKYTSFRVEERDVPISELNEFTSAFITNSILEIMPVSLINNKVFSIAEVKKIVRLFEDIKKRFSNEG